MKKYNIILLLLIILLQFNTITCYCKNNENKLIITAKIVSYHNSALIADYDDGSFEHFDATKLIIIKPDNYTGKEFYLYHQYEPEKNSFWHDKSAVVIFSMHDSIDMEKLDSSEIYSSGVKVFFVEIPPGNNIKNKYKPLLFFEPLKTVFMYTHGGEPPLINHVRIKITNKTINKISFHIDKLEFYSSNHGTGNPLILDPTWIKIDTDNNSLKNDASEHIKINPGQNTTVNLFFKGFEYSPASYDDTYVLVYLTCDKKKYLVRSDINIIRKEPLNKNK